MVNIVKYNWSRVVGLCSARYGEVKPEKNGYNGHLPLPAKIFYFIAVAVSLAEPHFSTLPTSPFHEPILDVVPFYLIFHSFSLSRGLIFLFAFTISFLGGCRSF